MSEQTSQDDPMVELSEDAVEIPQDDLTSLVAEQAKTIKELAAVVNELRNAKPSEVEGYIVFTPDQFEKDGTPIPGYNGSTGGMRFSNGIAYLSKEDLEHIPPIPEKPEHRMEPDVKIAWICKDFGYRFERGTAATAMELMGGMGALKTKPEIAIG